MAGVSIKGGTRQLLKLLDQANFLSSPEPFERINKLCAAAALTLLRQEFATSTGPYGEPWAPLKRRQGQPLLDTGRLRNSFSATNISAGSFAIETSVVYAGVHQYGAIINRGARVNAHARSGRFLSRAKAGKRIRSVRISISPAGQIVIPQRQMVPMGDWGKWGPVLEKEAEDYLRRKLGT